MSGNMGPEAYENNPRPPQHPPASVHTGTQQNLQPHSKQAPIKSQQVQTPRPVATPAASRPIGRDINRSTSLMPPGVDANAVSKSGKRTKAKLDDFILLKTVGKGSFGKVVMVRKKDNNQIYAMKILKKEMVLRRMQYEHTLSERRILENIDHPYIVSLRFAFQSEHKLYMVFDFFNGGELYHYLSQTGLFGETRARFYAAQITLALEYLHERSIVYRDLKPENLILDAQGHIRITDFGLSKEGVEGDTLTSICGTPEYLAPEILRRKPYGFAVDWWSLGTLLYEMIIGLPPFYDRNRPAMYRKILEAPLEPPPTMSKEAADICARMLERNPTKRLGYNGAHEIKSHPFFASIDWDKLAKKELPPPWVPVVSGETDTRNISSDFTSEPAAVTPSPAGSRLRDIMASTPPSFTDFSFAQESVLEGEGGRNSSAERQEGFTRDGMPLKSQEELSIKFAKVNIS